MLTSIFSPWAWPVSDDNMDDTDTVPDDTFPNDQPGQYLEMTNKMCIDNPEYFNPLPPVGSIRAPPPPPPAVVGVKKRRSDRGSSASSIDADYCNKHNQKRASNKVYFENTNHESQVWWQMCAGVVKQHERATRGIIDGWHADCHNNVATTKWPYMTRSRFIKWYVITAWFRWLVIHAWSVLTATEGLFEAVCSLMSVTAHICVWHWMSHIHTATHRHLCSGTQGGTKSPMRHVSPKSTPKGHVSPGSTPH